MATGEQVDTITQGIRIDNPTFNLTDLARQFKNMSAEERESNIKKLQKMITSIRNGAGVTAEG